MTTTPDDQASELLAATDDEARLAGGDTTDDGPLDDGPLDDGPLDDGPLDDGPLDDGPLDDGPLDDGIGQDRERSRGLLDVPRTFEQMRFVDVVMVLPSTNPVLVLEEVSPPCRRLHIPIGTPEGVAIAYAAQGIPTPKPLTHELFVAVLEAHGLTIEYLRITEAHQGSFSAELVVSGPSGSRTLACRPSDGIALALRQRLGAPIVVAPAVLDEVGVEE